MNNSPVFLFFSAIAALFLAAFLFLPVGGQQAQPLVSENPEAAQLLKDHLAQVRTRNAMLVQFSLVRLI